MANRMQKLLFNISTVSPMGFILACVYWVQQNVPQIVDEVTGKVVLQKQHYFLLFFLVFCFCWSFYGNFFIKKSKQKLERVPIAIDSVSCSDGWAIGIFVAYAVPLASFVFEDYNQLITICIMSVLLIIATLSNAVLPSPLLIIKGYHFYSVTNVNGGGDFCLISKRPHINNRNIVKKVVCAFDYFLIEMR